MRLARVLPLLLCAVAVCAQPVRVFEVKLTPAQMPVDGSGLQSLHWSIEKLPADILLADQNHKDQVVKAIARLSARPECHGAFYLDASRTKSCSLLSALADLIRFAGPAPFDKPPSSSATAPSGSVIILAMWAEKALPNVSSLCIVTAIDGYQTDNCAIDDPSALTVPLGSLGSASGLGPLSTSAAAVRIRVHGPTNPLPQATEAELQKAAVTLYKIATGLKIAPGAQLPADAQTKVEQAAVAAYSIQDSNWPKPVSEFRATAPGGNYVLTLRNLTTVTDAKVVLTQGNEAVLLTPDAAASLADFRKRKACELDAKYKARLESIVGTIPTTDSAWKISKVIAHSPELNPPVIPEPPSAAFQPCPGEPSPSDEKAAHRMEFTAVRRFVFANLNGTVNAGISASPHGILSGTGQISESQLLLKTSETWADSGSLNIDGGVEVQTANASFGFGRSVGTSQTLAFGVDIDGIFLRDQNQRYGYLAGPKFVDEEYGANPNVYLTWTRPAKLYALNAVVKTSVAEQFRHVQLDPPAGYAAFLNHGWVNGFDPTFSAVVGYDFTHSRPATKTGGGLGQAFVSLSGDFLAARTAAGGDFNFNRYSAAAAAEVFFGVTGTGDFFVRYDRGVSASSSGTPLFELPQLGGAENIRSIEQGEFIGRAFGFDRSELAVNAVSAWNWIRRRPPAAQARPDQSAAASASAKAAPAKPNTSLASLGITGIYIGGLYDRARVGPSSALANLFDLSHGLHGSGVEGEIRGLPAGGRRVNVDFIYSRSPNSILHRNGVFITSVSFDF